MLRKRKKNVHVYPLNLLERIFSRENIYQAVVYGRIKKFVAPETLIRYSWRIFPRALYFSFLFPLSLVMQRIHRCVGVDVYDCNKNTCVNWPRKYFQLYAPIVRGFLSPEEYLRDEKEPNSSCSLANVIILRNIFQVIRARRLARVEK